MHERVIGSEAVILSASLCALRGKMNSSPLPRVEPQSAQRDAEECKNTFVREAVRGCDLLCAPLRALRLKVFVAAGDPVRTDPPIAETVFPR